MDLVYYSYHRDKKSNLTHASFFYKDKTIKVPVDFWRGKSLQDIESQLQIKFDVEEPLHLSAQAISKSKLFELYYNINV